MPGVEHTKSFYGMSPFGVRTFSGSGVSQTLAAHLSSEQIEVTGLDPVRIGERDVQPLGEREIAFRWTGRTKWIQMKFLMFPDSCFGDVTSFDIAFSFVDNRILTKKYPALLDGELADDTAVEVQEIAAVHAKGD
jgi:hypothetical protein